MATGLSLVQELAALPLEDQATVIDGMGEERARSILDDWLAWARPDQVTPPGDWRVWLICAGRGWGKSLAGAEDVKQYGLAHPGSRIAIVAPTYADARDTCVEGQTGLLNRLDPDTVDTWNRSLGELILKNGTRYKLFSSDSPDRLRGPQNHRAWCDEAASWVYPTETWDMLMFGLRLGDDPRAVVTTTPKPIGLIKDLIARSGVEIGRDGADVYLTRGSTFENRENLAPSFLSQIVQRYKGSRLAAQELLAQVLEDIEGALWSLDLIHAHRVAAAPELSRVVVAVDPSGGSDAGHDEQGIVVAGKAIDIRGTEHGYVLADRSCRLSPDGWGRRAVQAYLDFKADAIVAEANYGGQMVESVIRTAAAAMALEWLPTKSVPVRLVTASRGKQLRAEPIAAMYENGRIHHVGTFDELEDQMRTWTPGASSPDRLDAVVHALTDLLLGPDRSVVSAPNPLSGYRG